MTTVGEKPFSIPDTDEVAPDHDPRRKRLALVASKGGLDEVYPILIMASTAAALGWEVGVFCTFYGLDMVNTKRMHSLKVSPIGNAAAPATSQGQGDGRSEHPRHAARHDVCRNEDDEIMDQGVEHPRRRGDDGDLPR